MTPTEKPYVDPEAIRSTIEAVRAQPELGQVTFNMRGRSIGGVALESTTGPLTQNGQADESRRGRFTLISDEPTSLLGGDQGVSPAEYALKTLASCYTVTLTFMAAVRGITLNQIRIDLNFDIDLNGFLGIDPSVRNGAQSIRADVHLESENGTPEQLREMVELLPERSPLHDTLANPVNIVVGMV